MFNRNILQYLKEWKMKENRKPLVLRGARQVGKTYSMKFFGQKYFNDLIYINLDKSGDYELFKDVESLEDFKKIVKVVLKKNIKAGETLIFIDEIQNTPNLISLLRFFYEDWPELHVVAAGSLLEVKIRKEGMAMPVGRIEYAYLYPLTFFEFLEASGEEKLLNFLKNIILTNKVPPAIHNQALKLFYDYALIGGMPEVVSLYLNKSSQEQINTLYSSLLTAYAEDIYKYASEAEVKYIKHILEQAPYFAGERITYEKFGGSQYKSREISQAFDILSKAMIVHQIQGTKSNNLPLIGQKKRTRKLLYLDVGFMNFKNTIQQEYIKVSDLNNLYRGKVAEQIVGQSIVANFMHSEHPLYYWAKEKPFGSAEVDFCLVHHGSILGIEVKSGQSNRLKSLLSFANTVENFKLIRIYSGVLKKEKITNSGRSHSLLSIPFYLVDRVLDL